ncbi:MAG: PAS domain-containing protein [Planctomycetaceae bacterium]|nr:PAS domain-containing protein [Planctomycetaceae bacterium]
MNGKNNLFQQKFTPLKHLCGDYQLDLEWLLQSLENLSFGIIISDPNQANNPIIYANGAVSRLTGFSSQELLGQSYRMLQGNHDDPKPLDELRQADHEADEKSLIDRCLESKALPTC